MKKVGLLGGSFDPVHRAHIEVGRAAKQQLGLDEIWVLIDKEPRFKEVPTPYRHRLEMVRLATSGHGFFVVDKLDVQRVGTTYGVQTLLAMRRQFPGHDFTIITGLDVIAHFDRWENPSVFMANATFAVAARPGHSHAAFDEMLERLGDKARDFHYEFIDMEQIPVSSTEIRAALKEGLPAESHIHDMVRSYIEVNRLYQ